MIDITSERLVELRPSWPIADVNVVARIRCESARLDSMISETRALIARHHVACQWFLDSQTQPQDLGAQLARLGITPDPEPVVTVMVLGPNAALPPIDPRIEVRDALSSLPLFTSAGSIQREAFGMTGEEHVPHTPEDWERARQDKSVLHFIALYDGEPAGAANAVVDPQGWMLAGGATRPSMRGRGVFRALVSERWRRALSAGAPGVAVHAGRMSAPILSRLGFETVGELAVYRDEGTLDLASPP